MSNNSPIDHWSAKLFGREITDAIDFCRENGIEQDATEFDYEGHTSVEFNGAGFELAYTKFEPHTGVHSCRFYSQSEIGSFTKDLPFELEFGDSREEINKTFGDPQNKGYAGTDQFGNTCFDTDVYLYPNAEVTLIYSPNGTLDSIQLLKPGRYPPLKPIPYIMKTIADFFRRGK